MYHFYRKMEYSALLKSVFVQLIRYVISENNFEEKRRIF